MNTHPSKQRARIARSNTFSGAGGKRPAIAGPQQSTLQQLEQVVTCEPIWALIENLEAFHSTADPALRRGPGRRYTLMDIVVMEAATQLDGSSREAERTLGDPPTWGGLRRAAARAFPNDPKRRLSPNAPSRHQHYQARRRYLCGEALTVLKRGLRAEAVSAAVRMGMFDPAAGSCTRPHRSQCIVGDATWIRAESNPGRFGVSHPANKGPRARSRRPGTGCATSDGPQEIPRRALVMLAGRSPAGDKRIVLDAELIPSDNIASREVRYDADMAVEMLRRLLDENDDLLRPGLRGFIYNMAMRAEAIDKTLDMRVLPITKAPRSASGGHRQFSLGNHTFTARDGTRHNRDVAAIGGSPAVMLVDNRGAKMAVPLRRQHLRWRRSSRQRHIAYCRYTVPDSPPAPANLRGASTTIRLNSTDEESRCHPHTRRTQALRAIPETDPGFAVYNLRDDAESALADLKHQTGSRLLTSGDDDLTLGILTYQMLQLAA